MNERIGQPQEAKIARPEEEKAILWAIIEELEVWMHGEGCFISARTKAKLEIARTLVAPVEKDIKRYRVRLFTCYQEDQNQKPKRSRTPEAKAKHAERMRAYWAERRKQSANEKELS